MPKARITVTAVLEYEFKREWYPEECDTDEKRLQFDIEAHKGDIGIILSDDRTRWSFKGELIEEATDHE